MAKNQEPLVSLLRQTAERLDDGARYEWGHMGRCNCGHLVQTLTNLTDREIAATANHQLDEWSEHAKDYCSQTGSRVDDLFLALAEVGFQHKDVMASEYLNDPRVLASLRPNKKRLRRNDASDVSLYMRALADILEEEKSLIPV